MRERKEKFRGIKKYESVLKNYICLYHLATVPSYIYDGTVEPWQKNLHFYMFSIPIAELLWASDAKFFLHLAYTIPIVNALR